MKKESNVEWTAVADMMSGLMVIFLLLALTFISEAQEQYDKYITVQERLYQYLIKEFEVDLKSWNAEIEKETLTLRFKEPDILFQNGSSIPNEKFKEIIKDFFPRYVSILNGSEFIDKIEEIRIEGHTSSKGRVDQSDINEKYFYNLQLSQERARNVLTEALNTIDSKTEDGKKAWLRAKLTANGLSSSKLIMKSSYNGPLEDEERSRRVEFRVKLRTHELIHSLDFGKAGNEIKTK